MLETFLFFLELGCYHVLDFNGLDHFYFLIIMTLPFVLKEWKQLAKCVTLFTLGHCCMVFISHYFKFNIEYYWVEILIPSTIIYSCISVILKFNKLYKSDFFKHINILTLFFGLIHGLGFGRYFSQIVQEELSFISLLGFSFGIELAQLLIASGVLVFNILIIKSFSKRFNLWINGSSFIVLILSLKMVFERI